MKITFNTLGTQEAERQYTDKQDVSKAKRGTDAYRTGFLTEQNTPWAQSAFTGREKGKSLIELQQEAGNIDVAAQQDYMTVMSHTMSEEDYARLSEEGFHFDGLDPEEAVTIVDKIKAELARSGQYIVGYTDDLDIDTLAAAVGSDALARTIADSFAQADIPLTQENISSVAKAWDMASQLEAPGEGASYYMIDNGLEPEIWNLYLAQSSGAESMSGAMPRYYAEEIQGYFTRSAGGMTDAGLQEQMDKVIAEAGKEIDAESRQQAQWLMKKGLPLTVENLKLLDELQEISFPVSEETFARAAASAMAEGREPVHANLNRQENLYEKAAKLAENYYEDRISFLDAGDVTARRQLEEIRLRMTAEVNVKLLKSGFAIDTAPMEQLLEALKQAEAQLADSYFPGDAEAVGKYELYCRTTQVVEELPGLPAQTVGSWADRVQQGSIARFHAEGKELQQHYEKAQESYEALMTAPRSDLGDNIRKAFANVDEILSDLGYDLTGENRRAIRILGYNRMNMTAENLEKVRTVDAQVRSVVERMTPAATLKMIRDGVNPLERSFEELEGYFDSLPEEYEERAESYSRFLYQLEQHQEISSEEREAYIGVYRLLHQIEKSDGAAIGAVVNSQMEVQFKNLLAAVRSSRFKHMDVRATDETGLLTELVKGKNSISEQITDNIRPAGNTGEKGIKGALQPKGNMTDMSQNNGVTYEDSITYGDSDDSINRQYNRMVLEQTRQAAWAEGDSAALLQRGGLTPNAGNLLAAQALLHDPAAPYKKWQEKSRQLSERESAETAADEMKMSDKDSFQEDYLEMLSGLRRQVEDATLNGANNSLDVRELQTIHKQLSVAAALSDSEEYILPMYIGDELAKVHLTVTHEKAPKGEVAIQADISGKMHVEAYFQLSDKGLSGFLVGNTGEEVTKLQKTADIFRELFEQENPAGLKVGELPIVSSAADRSMAGTGRSRETLSTEPAETTQQADSAGLYRVAKLFLQAIKQ